MKNDIYLFRITHKENIPHILNFGITYHNSVNRNPKYVSIGDPSLISTRSSFRLNSGRLLGEYIPFYFGYCMPMLYVIQNGFNDVKAIHPEEIIYCVLTVELIQKLNLNFIFTNGHALNYGISENIIKIKRNYYF